MEGNMKSEKKTDIFGNEKTVHYDDLGRVVGETKMEKDLFGNEYAVHYDAYGHQTGKSSIKTSFFEGEKIEHFDEYGYKRGESYEKTPLFGEKKMVHTDEYGRVIGESYAKSPLFGSDYVDTKGNAAGYYPGYSKSDSGSLSDKGSAVGSPSSGSSSGGSYSGGGSGGAASAFSGGAFIMSVELVLAIALYAGYCFMIRNNHEIITMIRSLVCIGLCPLLSILCILKNRVSANATSIQRKARNDMLTATITLFFALEVFFLGYTNPDAEGDALLSFVLFLWCWLPKVVYSIWAGKISRKSDVSSTREICDSIFKFASEAFAITMCCMELVNVLAGETSGSIARIAIVVLPGFVILWLVISFLTKLTDKLYRKIAG